MATLPYDTNKLLEDATKLSSDVAKTQGGSFTPGYTQDVAGKLTPNYNGGFVPGAPMTPPTPAPAIPPTTTPTTPPSTTPSAPALPSQNELSTQQKALQTAQDEYQTRAKAVEETLTNINNGTIPLSAGEQAQIDGLKQQFQTLIKQQELTNIGASGTGNIRGYQKGAAEYDPTFQVKTIGSIVTAGQNKVADLNVKMASAVAALTEAFRTKNAMAVKDAWAIYQDASEKRTAAIQKTIDDTQELFKEAEDRAKEERDFEYQVYKDNLELQRKNQEELNKVIADIGKSGAPIDVITAVSNAGSIADAVAAAGEYLMPTTGPVGEYLFYKRQAQAAGQVPVDFNTYQEIDANRKRSIVNVGIGGGDGTYTAKQLAALTKLNENVAGNDTYKKTTSMRTYVNNVLAALSAKNGVSDIAAINQFQKVIDEGAVTRDQDVKLIQGAQSLANSLKTRLKRLERGDQLSEEQREQMRSLVNNLYSAQTKAIEADPYIKAKRKEAELSGIAIEDTVLGELSSFGTSAGADAVVNAEEQAKTKVQNAPDDLTGAIQKMLKEGKSYLDIVQITGL